MSKYNPNKVFIQQNGTYIELSYGEFREREKLDPAYANKLFFPIQGVLLEVDMENYKLLYREQERFRYLTKLDYKQVMISLNELPAEVLGSWPEEESNVTNIVEKRVMIEQMHKLIRLLSTNEQQLLKMVFYDGYSLRKIEERTGIPRATLNYRLHKILFKLRKMFQK